MRIDYDLFREKLNALNGEIFKATNEQQVLPVLAIHQILKECEVEEMTDKISSEDFIKAFGGGIKQMENIKPIVIDCKYYLPCGICDKTNGLCSQFKSIELQPKSDIKASTDNTFYIPADNNGLTPV